MNVLNNLPQTGYNGWSSRLRVGRDANKSTEILRV